MEVDLIKYLQKTRKYELVYADNNTPFRLWLIRDRVSTVRCEGQTIHLNHSVSGKIAVAGFAYGGFGTDFIKIVADNQIYSEPFFLASPHEGIENRLGDFMIEEQKFFQNGTNILWHRKKNKVYFFIIKSVYNNVKSLILPDNRALNIAAISFV